MCDDWYRNVNSGSCFGVLDSARLRPSIMERPFVGRMATAPTPVKRKVHYRLKPGKMLCHVENRWRSTDLTSTRNPDRVTCLRCRLSFVAFDPESGLNLKRL